MSQSQPALFHWIVNIAGLFLPVFAALNILAVAVGTTRPLNPALAGFAEGCEDQARPCWYGLVPGLTRLDEADHLWASTQFELVRASGFHGHYLPQFQPLQAMHHCKSSLDVFDTVVQSVYLYDCEGLSVGDMIALLGTPTGICLHYNEVGLIFNQAGSLMVSGGSVFSPFTAVQQIRLEAPRRISLLAWNGFRDYSRFGGAFLLPIC